MFRSRFRLHDDIAASPDLATEYAAPAARLAPTPPSSPPAGRRSQGTFRSAAVTATAFALGLLLGVTAATLLIPVHKPAEASASSACDGDPDAMSASLRRACGITNQADTSP